ncbi:MAG TPA: hypothetical protein VKB09_10515 [Thermomicrobiales bacterium]|nr:hypothetical protein [Thermomicrobiales bacterium]
MLDHLPADAAVALVAGHTEGRQSTTLAVQRALAAGDALVDLAHHVRLGDAVAQLGHEPGARNETVVVVQVVPDRDRPAE